MTHKKLSLGATLCAMAFIFVSESWGGANFDSDKLRQDPKKNPNRAETRIRDNKKLKLKHKMNADKLARHHFKPHAVYNKSITSYNKLISEIEPQEFEARTPRLFVIAIVDMKKALTLSQTTELTKTAKNITVNGNIVSILLGTEATMSLLQKFDPSAVVQIGRTVYVSAN
ncbi:MAG: hypothetical protein B7Y25_06515 [Alphaproteobacteria bacterium 16-39-46]|nr:MAG: hypothetical protein B7Y25_06515 [Alphaproteobacteria bacterium 16-39-46]OZA42291.1 MAG: hypothetical protein B7X84_06590 [Alphaproteobacteria bacterium 17-39-52]HQS84040.1 hypothetical protein [Alphaproteobacteria bacterium]HQS93903.1 hypothetical protein [Alphaproteobacteria bacterium]